MPSEPDPIAQVHTGMRVIDATGAELGTVAAVQQAGTIDQPQIDLTPAVAERLAHAGFVQVDAGLLGRDLYVAADQVAEVAEGDGVAPGVVRLGVARDEVTRAG